ncbi:epoxyqueuosine reductase QueH [Peptoclostridium litorale]|uniref:epoxyqueuosine reductase QueH n=1 Tax=Peptoclostridium litorale TaxID=1557 RepID=UPI000570035C|nr:epoxyqueuosine reductase QueH [Peptoclostridium litorale]
MKINYQKLLDENIYQIQKKGTRPSLLIHSCCAPCSSYVIEYLSNYFDITVFFYNPNIHPEEEYRKRVIEQMEFIRKFPSASPVSFVEAVYDVGSFFAISRGLENEPERGKRCTLCFGLRLEQTARYAAENGFNYYTTTLSISPHKDAQLLNSMGEKLGENYGVSFLSSDFKKKNGYKRSCELSLEYGLYRQDYCGCVYSKIQSDAQRESQQNTE